MRVIGLDGCRQGRVATSAVGATVALLTVVIAGSGTVLAGLRVGTG